MKRADHFYYVEERLATLAVRVENRAKLNDLSLHIHAEDFYERLLNHLFEWQLGNVNIDKPNTEGIDLVDVVNKVVVQVSSQTTRKKVEDSLGKDLSAYKGYLFAFVSISKSASHLRGMEDFKNPHGLEFDPRSDIHDVSTILKRFKSLDVGRQQSIRDFLEEELGTTAPPLLQETNLARIISILATEDWSPSPGDLQTVPYDVGRKITHNKLGGAKLHVDDYAVYHPRVEKKYKEFDQLGVNKRSSVIGKIRSLYAANKTSLNGDDLYDEIFRQVVRQIQESANYMQIPQEELEQCIHILVVDAFVRCKIFENPEGYKHASL